MKGVRPLVWKVFNVFFLYYCKLNDADAFGHVIRSINLPLGIKRDSTVVSDHMDLSWWSESIEAHSFLCCAELNG